VFLPLSTNFSRNTRRYDLKFCQNVLYGNIQLIYPLEIIYLHAGLVPLRNPIKNTFLYFSVRVCCHEFV